MATITKDTYLGIVLIAVETQQIYRHKGSNLFKKYPFQAYLPETNATDKHLPVRGEKSPILILDSA